MHKINFYMLYNIILAFRGGKCDYDRLKSYIFVKL